MRPFLHPGLVNGRTGDPALYIETLFETETILFDLGDISNLPPRKIHRLEHVFVSHTHIDHFIGFDRLLRVLAGRQKKLNLYGLPDFIEQVQHKLHAYRWNLVDRYVNDLIFWVTEVSPLETRKAVFRLKNGFAIEAQPRGRIAGNVICSEPRFRVSTAILDHGTPCLAFAVEESAHVNIWKPKLLEPGLQVGPWLRELKRAIMEKRPDNHPIGTAPLSAPGQRTEMPLGTLRCAVTPGQKIAYVTDSADTAANRAAIIELVRNADVLFIEATFSQADASLAAERAHLTAETAGKIARKACVRWIEPFHFSPRYAEEEPRLVNEALAAFTGAPCEGGAAECS